MDGNKIRLEPEVDKSLKVKLNNTFDQLEVLSIKINSDSLYTKYCSDWGIVVGRVIANNGIGVPNCKVSIFIPLDDKDSEDPIISTLYPYKNISDLDTNGVRYNLLPKNKQNIRHVPVGTFPSESETVNTFETKYIYDKYYKYTTVTNESGDYMLFGVPVGNYIVHFDLDISDCGFLSTIPEILIQNGISENQFDLDKNGNPRFKYSTNLDSLTQIRSENKSVTVLPFWGDLEQCEIGISRVDFDSRFNFTPYSVFFGSVISNSDNLSGGSPFGYIDAMGVTSIANKTYNTNTGRNIISYDVDFERYNLIVKAFPANRPFEVNSTNRFVFKDGNFILPLPLHAKYYITNNFGDIVLAPQQDGSQGIATEGYYSFVFSLEDNQGRSTLQVGSLNLIYPKVASFSPTYGEYLRDKQQYAPVINSDRNNNFYSSVNLYGNYNHSSLNGGIALSSYMFNDDITLANPPSPNYDTNYSYFYDKNPVSNIMGRFVYDIFSKKINYYTIGLNIKRTKDNLASGDVTNSFPPSTTVNGGIQFFDEPIFLTNYVSDPPNSFRRIPSPELAIDSNGGDVKYMASISKDNILRGCLFIPLHRTNGGKSFNNLYTSYDDNGQYFSGENSIYDNYELMNDTEALWLNSRVISTSLHNITDLINVLPNTSEGFENDAFTDGNLYYFGYKTDRLSALDKVKQLYIL